MVAAKDSQLTLPNFTLVSASAGSGKTTALTLRFLQLLLSGTTPHNNLRNILAITFTNIAALEMKQRILEYLKKASFGDEETLRQMSEVINLDRDRLVQRAMSMVDHILDNYSDLQVQTIDSFLVRVLKISALEMGLPPQFDVVLDRKMFLDESFDLLARQLVNDVEKRNVLTRLVDTIHQSRSSDAKFIWNPYKKLADEVFRIYNLLTVYTDEPVLEETAQQIDNLRKNVLQAICNIGDLAEVSGFEVSKNYANIINSARGGFFDDIIDKSLTQKVINKPKSKSDLPRYEKIMSELETRQKIIMHNVAQYTELVSRTRLQPYIKAYRLLKDNIELMKRQHAQVYLGDANKQLARSIREFNIPEIYFGLGEMIHHFLIDEFQDTSPIQWEVLYPLIGEALSKSGSLFIVGDTKQAIFSFRGGDWQIMADMMKHDIFPSVATTKIPLEYNYRSGEVIVNFVKKVFHDVVPLQLPEEMDADLSGLVSYQQKPEEKLLGKGYVEVNIFDPPSDEIDNMEPEREKILHVIQDCLARGYKLRDIGILTPRNDDVVKISAWLNEANFSFISHSNLDIRTRKITGELIALLQFLDSPIDDLAFATFLMGSIFSSTLKNDGVSVDIHSFFSDVYKRKEDRRPLYHRFRVEHPQIWNQYFEALFNRVGYLPVYDLLVEVYHVYHCFDRFPEEEGTLVKLLEVINSFQQSGANSLKDFLRYADENTVDDIWNITTAQRENAITLTNIHKAKGLQYPIVILLLYDTMIPPDNEIFNVEKGEARLLYITNDAAGKNQELDVLYRRKRQLDTIDELNKLYVSLTRAEEELYVVCVKSQRFKKPSGYLPVDGYEQGVPTYKKQETEQQRDELQIIHPDTLGVLASKTFRKIGIEQTKRGEFIHQVLERITTIDNSVEQQLQKIIGDVQQQTRESINCENIKLQLLKFFEIEAFRSYFTPKPDRAILNEQEIVDETGELHRIDRLIVDADMVTILDYKTGDKLEEYHQQVLKYIDVVKRLYPDRDAHGILAYIDRMSLKEVQ